VEEGNMIDYKKDIEPNKLSNQKEFLKAAIGRKLLEVERFFGVSPEQLLETYQELNEKCDYSDYFSFNLGTTQFWFEGNFNQTFRFYSGGAPIIRFPGVYPDIDYPKKYQLSKMEHLTSSRLRNCLGQVCQDVRIWQFSESEQTKRSFQKQKEAGWLTAEELEQDIKELEEEIQLRGQEITDSGVSYVLSNGEEIIYCCNFYDSDLSDRLLFVEDLKPEYVYSCFSLGENNYTIQPKKFNFSYNQQ
jgi:hypothetical protein